MYECPCGWTGEHTADGKNTCPKCLQNKAVEVSRMIVKVRWWDGYIEEFECVEARAGAYLLWLKLTNGDTRHIPLCQVRWFNGLK